MATVHVVPLNDHITHHVPGGLGYIAPTATAPWLAIEADPNSPDLDCPCGPHLEYVGPNAWLVTHHSLDGRENTEHDAAPGYDRTTGSPT